MKFLLKLVFLISGVIVCLKFEKYDYLILGSFEEVTNWFSTYGLIIWVLKTLMIIFWIVTFFILFFEEIKKYKLYFLIIGLTVFIGEFFPFSHYPMYNHFPNWAYSFYMTDQNGQLLNKKVMPLSAGSFSHIYTAACKQAQIKYGDELESPEDLQKIGQFMMEQVLDEELLRKSAITKVLLYRLNNHFVEGKLIEDTLLMTSQYVE